MITGRDCYRGFVNDGEGNGALVRHRAGYFSAVHIGGFAIKDFRSGSGCIGSIGIIRTGAGNGSAGLVVRCLAFKQACSINCIAGQIHEGFAIKDYFGIVLSVSHF